MVWIVKFDKFHLWGKPNKVKFYDNDVHLFESQARQTMQIRRAYVKFKNENKKKAQCWLVSCLCPFFRWVLAKIRRRKFGKMRCSGNAWVRRQLPSSRNKLTWIQVPEIWENRSITFLYDNLTRKQVVFLCFYKKKNGKGYGILKWLNSLSSFQSFQGVNSRSKSSLSILQDEKCLAKGTVRLWVMSGLTTRVANFIKFKD